MTQTHSPILTIFNKHGTDCGPPPQIDATGKMVQYFENRYGEQFIFVGDRSEAPGDEVADLYVGDADWKKFSLSRQKMIPDMVSHHEEQMWLKLCWTSLLHENLNIVEAEYERQYLTTIRNTVQSTRDAGTTPEQLDKVFVKAMPTAHLKRVAKDIVEG